MSRASVSAVSNQQGANQAKKSSEHSKKLDSSASDDRDGSSESNPTSSSKESRQSQNGLATAQESISDADKTAKTVLSALRNGQNPAEALHSNDSSSSQSNTSESSDEESSTDDSTDSDSSDSTTSSDSNFTIEDSETVDAPDDPMPFGLDPSKLQEQYEPISSDSNRRISGGLRTEGDFIYQDYKMDALGSSYSMQRAREAGFNVSA